MLIAPNDLGFATDHDPCQTSGSIVDCTMTISASSTNPFVNSGPFDGISLFFWQVGVQHGSYGFYGESSWLAGDIHVTGFEPAPGVIGGVSQHPFGPVLWWRGTTCRTEMLGRLIVEMPVSVEGESWGRLKAIYR